jgi:hypothetical protein
MTAPRSQPDADAVPQEPPGADVGDLAAVVAPPEPLPRPGVLPCPTRSPEHQLLALPA